MGTITCLNCYLSSSKGMQTTHVELPLDLVLPGLGVDGALEVDVVALLDGVRPERRAEPQRHARQVCEREKGLKL